MRASGASVGEVVETSMFRIVFEAWSMIAVMTTTVS